MKTVLIIESDKAFRSQVTPWLNERGWSVVNVTGPAGALDLIRQHQPELILCDWPSPGGDSGRLCQSWREQHQAGGPGPLIIATGAAQGAGKFNALEAGADEFIPKPVDFRLLDKFLSRAAGSGRADLTLKPNGDSGPGSGARVKFWGVRGSIPTPGAETVFYGGNTSCVEIRVNNDIIVLDAGSGIRKLGLALIKEFKGAPIHLHLLITHTHWDHIQGFPFFLPAYDPKNKVTIYGFEGASQGLQSTLSSQMESPYFPISMQQMPGHLTIRELKELSFQVGGVPVKASFVNHPGICAGYRLFTPGGSISYIPDVELFQRLRTRWKTDTKLVPREERQFAPEEDRGLVDFIRGSEMLILDSQYDAAEYEHHIGWGHSCAEDSVAFALQAGVKRLFLFHHDPDHTDEQISRLVARARQMAIQRHSDLLVEAAREGCEVVLPALAEAKSA